MWVAGGYRPQELSSVSVARSPHAPAHAARPACAPWRPHAGRAPGYWVCVCRPVVSQSAHACCCAIVRHRMKGAQLFVRHQTHTINNNGSRSFGGGGSARQGIRRGQQQQVQQCSRAPTRRRPVADPRPLAFCGTRRFLLCFPRLPELCWHASGSLSNGMQTLAPAGAAPLACTRHAGRKARRSPTVCAAAKEAPGTRLFVARKFAVDVVRYPTATPACTLLCTAACRTQLHDLTPSRPGPGWRAGMHRARLRASACGALQRAGLASCDACSRQGGSVSREHRHAAHGHVRG